MSMSLPGLLQALSLPSTRTAIDKTASAMTEADSKASGFVDLTKMSLETHAKYSDYIYRTKTIMRQLLIDYAYMNAITKVEKELKPTTSPDRLTVVFPASKNLNDRLCLINNMNLSVNRVLYARFKPREDGEAVLESDVLAFGQDDSTQAIPSDESHQTGLTLPLVTLADHDTDTTCNSVSIHAAQAWFSLITIVSEETSSLSELAVQQTVGTALRKVLTLENCDLYSDQKVEFPSLLQMSIGSDPHPDFSSRVNFTPLMLDVLKEAQYDEKIISCMRPVVVGGEAKAHKDKGKKANPNAPSPRSQLQASVYPTLLLLLLQHGGLNARTAKLPGELHKYCYVYGVYYDSTTVEIYVHYPWYRQKTLDNPNDYGWRFAQVLMKSYTLPKDYSTGIADSIELAIALHVVRAHAEHLRDYFRSLERDETWREICKLGCDRVKQDGVETKKKSEATAEYNKQKTKLQDAMQEAKKEAAELAKQGDPNTNRLKGVVNKLVEVLDNVADTEAKQIVNQGKRKGKF